MDLYEENEHVISSDEYSDDNDDALMNDAVRAQNHARTSALKNRINQSKWIVHQKQKELSSLIRRNKISVIYKNKSIRWLNNKKKREQYKNHKFSISNNSNIDQRTPTTLASLELDDQTQSQKDTVRKCISSHIEEANGKEIIHNKGFIEGNLIPQKVSPMSTLTYSTQSTKLQPEKHGLLACVKIANHDEKTIQDIEKLEPPIDKEQEIPGKRTRSPTPPIFVESREMDIKFSGKKFKAVTPDFYKSINDIFPEFDKIATNYSDSISNPSLTAVEDNMKNLSNEINILNEILQVKEMEWKRLSHLKMVKEEIHSRLNKKKHILQLKESFSNQQNENILIELKELEFYLAEYKGTPETNHSSITIKNLIENRANMNAEDLQREKNSTSRLHSLLVSQNMLNAAESLENTGTISNGEKNDMELTSKNSEMCNHLGGRLLNNRGRQGEVRDVKSLIADFRQKNPKMLPRVGKRIKSPESKAQYQSYSIPSHLQDKTSLMQVFTKDYQPEFYSMRNSMDEISVAPIGCSKITSSSHDTDVIKLLNNKHNESFKSGVKEDFKGKCPKNIQYPLCQECKINESHFVCAGCENQWYCSKTCQISAWDKHSELCTE